MKFSQFAVHVALAATLLVSISDSGLAYQQNQTCGGSRRPCEANEQPHPIVWDRTCVLYYLDQAGSNDFDSEVDGQASRQLEQIVRASFDTWSRPDCSGINLIFGGQVDPSLDFPGERRNLVSFNFQDWSGSATTFATTVVNYNPNTGLIREADIIVNDQFYRFAQGSAPGPGEADLQNTLTHEVGHFLGMAHSRVAAATMYGSADLGETRKRSLHRDDINGLCAHYPVEEFDSSCGAGDVIETDQDDIGGDGGQSSFEWGSDDESPKDASACSVTGVHRSSILPPLVLIVGLFGGVLCWRRTRRFSDN